MMELRERAVPCVRASLFELVRGGRGHPWAWSVDRVCERCRREDERRG